MKKELEDFPKEKLSKLNDYFDGEERRSQKQNGENILWLEMSEEEIEEILEIKFAYKIYSHVKKKEEHEKEFQEWQKLSEEEKDERFFLGTLNYWEKKEYERRKTT